MSAALHASPVSASVAVCQPWSADDWRDAAALLHDYVEWVRAATGFEPLDAQPELVVELADVQNRYSRGDTMLFLARRDETAVGTIAVRFHRDGTAELKRMFVRDDARGRGIADDLVRTVLCVAGATGRRLVWLDAHQGSMERAIAVYRRHGFVETDDPPAGSGVDGFVVMERQLTDDECDARWTPC